MEKWPSDTKRTDKAREFELCIALTNNLCKNVIHHYSRSLDIYLSVTHHKLNSLTSYSNLVSLPKIYVLKLEQIEVVESLLADYKVIYDFLSNLPTGFGKFKLNLPSILLGKVEQKPEWDGFTIQQHRRRTS